jgi:hypothetical protein
LQRVIPNGQQSKGHPGDANNLGFCLEYGRGVEPNFETAAECCAFTRGRGHPEFDLSYHRCFRILSDSDVSDRSAQIADSQLLDNLFTHLFINSLNDPDLNPKFILSIH